MRKLVSVALVVLTACSVARPEFQVGDAVARSFVALHGKRPNGQSFGGSGFYVAPDRVLTAAHVEIWGQRWGLFYDEKLTQPARTIRSGPKLDLALLAAEELGPALTVCRHEAGVWDRVVILSSPLGASTVATLGVVAGVAPEVGTLLIDATVMPGMSGAPVVSLEPNCRGQVVGVIVQEWGSGRSQMAVAIGSGRVLEWLSR